MGKRDEVRRKNKDINRPVLFNRINFMAVYLIGIYLPYILYLSVKFDIAEISLSRIGWRMDGFPFLLVYCICINVFYLIFFGLMVQAFFTTGTTAIFETASTYINMVILFALNLFESRSRACY